MKHFFVNIYLRARSIGVVKRLRAIVSPLFLVMVMAATLLWFISKLGYSYTTELDVTAQIDGHKIELGCVVEGIGTNLVRYKVKGGGGVKIPLSELKIEHKEGGLVIIDKTSLYSAISVRFSDIKIISINSPQEITIEEKE